ncbi:lectin like domain-containing protein [Synergistaceae bacterium OttesenSCG-928-I11]|nr:lectin like domain-containing protein [Synergistaceae bacterium OttesenSCG-928-I11]
MKIRYRLVSTLVLALLLLLTHTLPAVAGNFRVPDFNPDFIEYLENVDAGREHEGFIPSPIDYRAIAERVALKAAGRTASLPVSYDLAAEGFLTSVKNQKKWGTCWDFATMEAMESNWLKRHGEEIFLSELHLGYFAYVQESLDKPAFDTSDYAQSESSIFSNGGTTGTSRAILSRSTGPVYEDDAPYPDGDLDAKFWQFYDPKLPSDMPARYRLKESLTFHKTDTDAIKSALMEHGALWIAFSTRGIRVDPVEGYNNPNIYNHNSVPMNHAVLLVGWDDTRSKDLFLSVSDDKTVPQNDGAWKIQNSWGTATSSGKPIGEDGFFWISYEDATIFGIFGAASFVAMPLDTYDNTYCHDPLGVVYNVGYSASDITLANAFTAKRGEDLVFVGFDTLDPDLDYAIQIYKNIPEGEAPSAGTPVLASPLRGSASVPGYRTAKLDAPIRIEEGERFAIAVTFTTAHNGMNIPLEARVKNFSSRAACAPGESYYLDGTEWKEVMGIGAKTFDGTGENTRMAYYTNACIKAFTKNAAPGDGSSGNCGVGGAAAILLLPALAFVKKRREIK